MFDTTKNYWFFLEPYVYANFTNNCVLLYNTLDGESIFVDNQNIVGVLQSVYKKENGGVVSLSGDNLDGEILDFIIELRAKFMGNIIDVSLSNHKPTQLIPLLNLQREIKRLKADSSQSIGEDIMTYLQKIEFHIEANKIPTSIMVNFINETKNVPNISLSGNMWDIQIIDLFYHHPATKSIICSYTRVNPQLIPENFIIKISVNFPVNLHKWDTTWIAVSEKKRLVEVIFEVACDKDCQKAEQLINQYGIEHYQLEPVYTGDNLSFFENNIYLAKEDILANPLSMREIFTHQALNTFDFGKIIVLANGDVHANIHHPPLGNIGAHSIKELIYKELEEGKSWLRVRDQAPCNDCVYQWLCPSPSNYEIVIGKPNLCHVKK